MLRERRKRGHGARRGFRMEHGVSFFVSLEGGEKGTRLRWSCKAEMLTGARNVPLSLLVGGQRNPRVSLGFLEMKVFDAAGVEDEAGDLAGGIALEVEIAVETHEVILECGLELFGFGFEALEDKAAVL